MDSETLVNSVIISKLIVEEIGDSPPYEEVVDIADFLDITIEQVLGFIKLYKQVQNQMVL